MCVPPPASDDAALVGVAFELTRGRSADDRLKLTLTNRRPQTEREQKAERRSNQIKHDVHFLQPFGCSYAFASTEVRRDPRGAVKAIRTLQLF